MLLAVAAASRKPVFALKRRNLAQVTALFLNERLLEWKNGVALLLVCWSIWLVTKEEPPNRR